MAYDHRRYRSRLRQDSKDRDRSRSRGRGRYSYFKLEERATYVRLFPGTYVGFDGIERQFFVKRTHFDKQVRKTRDCMGDECIPCWHRKMRQSKELPQRFNQPSSKYVYNLVHLHRYHEVEKDRRDGDGTFKVQEPCKGRRCRMCRDEVESVFGRKLHWGMNESDHKTLESYDDQLAAKCLCGEGDIDYKAYRCDSCDKVLRDAEDFEGTEIEFIRLGFEEHKCRHCGHTDLPVADMECIKEDDGEWESCCDDPRPAHIFAVDLEVKGVQKQGRGDTTWLGLQIVGHRFSELDDEVEKMMMEAFDFDSMYDMDLDTQAKILGMNVPKALKDGTSDDDDEDEEDEVEESVDYDDDDDDDDDEDEATCDECGGTDLDDEGDCLECDYE